MRRTKYPFALQFHIWNNSCQCAQFYTYTHPHMEYVDRLKRYSKLQLVLTNRMMHWSKTAKKNSKTEMKGLRVHLTLILATAIWSVLLGNKAALVGREAHEESSVLPAAENEHTQSCANPRWQKLQVWGSVISPPQPVRMCVCAAYPYTCFCHDSLKTRTYTHTQNVLYAESENDWSSV